MQSFVFKQKFDADTDSEIVVTVERIFPNGATVHEVLELVRDFLDGCGYSSSTHGRVISLEDE